MFQFPFYCRIIFTSSFLLLLITFAPLSFRGGNSSLSTATEIGDRSPTGVPFAIADGPDAGGYVGEGDSQKYESLSGTLSVIWADTFNGGNVTASVRYVLVTDEGRWINLQIDDNEVARLGGPPAMDRRRVRVTGNRVMKLDPEAFSAETFNAENIELESAANVTNAISGTQKWATILCRFGDSTAITPKPLSHFQTLMGSSYPGMDHYWREVSYGNISIEASTVVGWYNLPRPKSYYRYDKNGNGLFEADEFEAQKAAQDCSGVADADVFFPNYDGISFLFNEELAEEGYGAGLSNHFVLSIDGVSKDYGMVWTGPAGYGASNHHGSWVIAHEMGHTFGLPHSSGPYNETYDSNWDVMSGGSVCPPRDPNFGCIAPHTISYHKDLLGWIPPARKYTATGGTTSTINIERLAQPVSDSNYLMAQIPIGGSSTKFYTVETRLFAGYDVQVPGQAIVIHSVDKNRWIDNPNAGQMSPLNATYARVVDPDNNGNPNDAGAMWTVGETFSDAAHGISVTVNSINISSFNVTVTNSCTYSASTPTNVSFTPSGGTGALSVTASGSCEWEIRSDVNWINFSSGSTGSGNGTVTYLVAPNLSGPRTGNITVFGQTYTISQAAPSYSISGQVTAGSSGLGGVSMDLFLPPSQTSTATATTDANGTYSFTNLPGGGNYFFSPRKPAYSFEPQNRQFNNLSSNQTANFTGTPPGQSVSVSGRVLTSDGRGLRTATVSITDSNNVKRTATTSSFGFYSFDTVQTGQNYTIAISSRSYRFASRVVSVAGDLTDVDFVGLE